VVWHRKHIPGKLCSDLFQAPYKEITMSDGGKGSKPRPLSVSEEEYATRWDAIFGRDQPNPDSEVDKPTRNNEETQQLPS
jgi:hypothetical protein